MSYNKEYYKKYREKNKEKIALKNKLWRKNNPKKEKARQQRQKNSGYTSAYLKKYRQTVNCKFSVLRSRAWRRSILFLITKEKFIEWFNKQPRICRYCSVKVTMGIAGVRKNWLTIDRKNNNGSYFIDNIIISCHRCNLLKADDISYKVMIKIGKIIAKEKHNKTWNGKDWIKS